LLACNGTETPGVQPSPQAIRCRTKEKEHEAEIRRWRTTVAGDTVQVWIVSVHGTHLFVEAATTRQAGRRLGTEARQIVESIRFG
jgi:hypothetical protein